MLMDNLLILVIYSVFSGVAAFVFCRVLTSPGMILSFWPNMVGKLGVKWLDKILWECPVCLSFYLCLITMYFYNVQYTFYPLGVIIAMFTAYELNKRET